MNYFRLHVVYAGSIEF